MANNYSANDIQQFEFPTSIYKRPSMYLGARGTQQSTSIRELVDNSIHECVRGYASKVYVSFGLDKSITVQDDGRGLPTDMNEKRGVNGIILTMATLHAGANFGGVEKGKAGAGLNGVGAASTNAMSKRFDVIVYRDGKEHRLSFQDGYPGHFEGEGPDAPFTPSKDIRVVKDSRKTADKKKFKTGTKIKLWHNEDRFPEEEKVDIDDLVDRMKYTAYIVPGITIDIVDDNRQYEDGSSYSWHFRSDNGLREMLEVESTDPMLPDTDAKGDLFSEQGIHMISTEGRYNEITVDSNNKNTTETRYVTADLAFRYGTGYERKFTSFVNTIHTHLGGVHEQALETALVKAFGTRMASMRGILTAKDEPPIAVDYFEGLTATLSINVPEPQFVGQQKDKLSGPEVKKALTKALTEELTEFANAPQNQKLIRPMFEKIVQASKNRKAAADAKQAKRKSTQLSSSAMPAKLADCDLTDTEEAELIICEGDSAAGTVIKARDATYQAVIPIRGKILNSFTATDANLMKNDEVMAIAKAIGAGFGKNFDIEKIRYGKILFAADADVDGLHINSLLYTVFNRMFKPMLEEGRVYQTMPPLFEVTVGTGRNKKTLYALDDSELDNITKKLDKDGKKYSVMRNKGLGAMSPESFSETVLDPETRSLRRITIEDGDGTDEALEVTMGSKAAPRKEFMAENFQAAIDSGLVEGFESGTTVGV